MTVLVVQLLDYHYLQRIMGMKSLLVMLNSVLDSISIVLNQYRGELHEIQGDLIVCTFNGVKKCLNHGFVFQTSSFFFLTTSYS